MVSEGVNRKVAVIGAGPAGLAAAYKLVQGGCSVDLYEAGPEVGGMSRSLELWGHIVDLGPHRFFSGNEEVNQFWFQAIGDEFCWVKRQTRIYYKGRFFNYPLQAWNTFVNLGFRESLLSLASYARHPEIGRAEALRRASLRLMNDRSNPAFANPAAWAPFVVIGDGR